MADTSAVSSSANDLRERRQAREPKHDEETRRRWRERKRAKRSGETTRVYRRRNREDESDEESRPPYKPDEMSIKMCGKLGALVWNFSRMFHGRRELTDKEQRDFGEALDPVLYKYLPALNDWAVEMNLLGTCVGIWNATTPEPKPADSNAEKSTDSSAEVIEE